MSHKKSWACIKPDGDGCDGNHTSSLTALLDRLDRLEKEFNDSPWHDDAADIAMKYIVESRPLISAMREMHRVVEKVVIQTQHTPMLPDGTIQYARETIERVGKMFERKDK